MSERLQLLSDGGEASSHPCERPFMIAILKVACVHNILEWERLASPGRKEWDLSLNFTTVRIGVVNYQLNFLANQSSTHFAHPVFNRGWGSRNPAFCRAGKSVVEKKHPHQYCLYGCLRSSMVLVEWMLLTEDEMRTTDQT